jgi:hypothetical protein
MNACHFSAVAQTFQAAKRGLLLASYDLLPRQSATGAPNARIETAPGHSGLVAVAGDAAATDSV